MEDKNEYESIKVTVDEGMIIIVATILEKELNRRVPYEEAAEKIVSCIKELGGKQ